MMNRNDNLPDRIESIGQLEDLLSEPDAAVVESLARVEGDVILLGVGGKMGPTLARMARRASDAAGVKRRVIGVARFSAPETRQALEAAGVETIRCDLLDERELAALPDAANVIYMPALKFGSSADPSLAWAMNAVLPCMVCRKYAHSRIVAFSTGNVYPFTSPDSGGPDEGVPPAPLGEYAMSCLGRERVFEYFSRSAGLPVCTLRLNYAHELRYGVMVDISQTVQRGEPIDLATGYFNAIWQGDANRMTLRALEHAASPPLVLNIAGREVLSVREVALEMGRLAGKESRFVGQEAGTALLSNGRKAIDLFGPATVDESTMLRWIADWTARGMETLDKPTRFEVRDGRF